MAATALPGRSAPAREQVLARRVRLLVAGTISYNMVEAAVALTAGAAASSTALVGFGLDSLIEVSSAAAVAWQFAAPTARARQDRERRALRIIAVSFFALAAYVSVEAVRTLVTGGQASASRFGLALAALSLLVMPVLSAAQRRTGRELGSVSAVADSQQTLLCTYLSAVLLVGLALNGAFGWGWADPAAGLVIAVLALVEGRRAWHGDSCCAPGLPASRLAGEDGRTAPDEQADACCGPTATCCAAPAGDQGAAAPSVTAGSTSVAGR
jgi:divalent metal cation (Fe/Co/Zn/Cd) transporter